MTFFVSFFWIFAAFVIVKSDVFWEAEVCVEDHLGDLLHFLQDGSTHFGVIFCLVQCVQVVLNKATILLRNFAYKFTKSSCDLRRVTVLLQH